MTVEEFIAQDPHESLMSTYRMVDEDVCVSMISRNGDMPMYMIDYDVEACLAKHGLTSYYAVLHMKNVFWIGPDARNWIKGELASKVVKGYAVIAESQVKSVLADVWVKIVNLPFPVKKFRSYEEGLKWVRTLKKSHQKVTWLSLLPAVSLYHDCDWR